jgi:hypothetical protein
MRCVFHLVFNILLAIFGIESHLSDHRVCTPLKAVLRMQQASQSAAAQLSWYNMNPLRFHCHGGDNVVFLERVNPQLCRLDADHSIAILDNGLRCDVVFASFSTPYLLFPRYYGDRITAMESEHTPHLSWHAASVTNLGMI